MTQSPTPTIKDEESFFEYQSSSEESSLLSPEFQKEDLHYQLHDKMKVGTIYTPIVADVYLGTEQSDVVDKTETIVALGSVAVDTASSWNLTNHYFKAPVDGYYHFDAIIAYGIESDDMVDGKSYWAILRKNGSTSYAKACVQAAKTGAGTSGDGLNVMVSKTIELAKDEYVELIAYHDAGVNTVDILNLSTYLTVYLVGHKKGAMNIVPPPPPPPSN